MSKIFTFLFILISISIYFNYNVFQSHKIQRPLLDQFNSGKLSEEVTAKFENTNFDYPNLTVTAIPIKHLLSRYYFLSGDYNRAFQLIEEGKKANPYFQLGNVLKSEYFEKLKINDSMSFYGSLAFEKSPRNMRHFMAKMKSVAYENSIDELVKSYRIIENESNTNFHLVFLSTLLTFKNVPDSIKLISKEIAKKFPNNVQIRVATDMIYYGQENINKSIEENKRANEFFKNNDLDKALVHYKKALEYNPEDYVNYENIGVIYLKKKKPLIAIDFLSRIVEGDVNRSLPLDGKAEFLMGSAYIDLNNKTEACKFLKMSKNLNNKFGYRLYGENCNN